MDKRCLSLMIYAMMLAIILISGCISHPLNQPPCPNCTVVPSAPSGDSADLHQKGFDAYVNLDYATALDYYNQSLAADPNYTRAWIDKGNVLARMNRSAEAVSAYDAALAIDSSIAEVWNLRGKTLMAAGNYTGARDSFDHALQLVPDYREAQDNRNLTLAKLK
jgi:tetratricopeptide (TPR) repeat protein